MPKLKDATAQKRQMSQQSGEQTGFRKVLAEACEQKSEVKKPKDIACYTTGYTKTAMPYVYQVNLKEYC